MRVVSFSSSSCLGPRRDARRLRIDEKTTPDAIDATPRPATRRAGNVYGPPLGTNLVVFIDDMNMPKVDTYGVPSCRGAFTSLIRLVAIARCRGSFLCRFRGHSRAGRHVRHAAAYYFIINSNQPRLHLRPRQGPQPKNTKRYDVRRRHGPAGRR